MPLQPSGLYPIDFKSSFVSPRVMALALSQSFTLHCSFNLLNNIIISGSRDNEGITCTTYIWYTSNIEILYWKYFNSLLIQICLFQLPYSVVRKRQFKNDASILCKLECKMNFLCEVPPSLIPSSPTLVARQKLIMTIITDAKFKWTSFYLLSGLTEASNTFMFTRLMQLIYLSWFLDWSRLSIFFHF